MLTKTVWGLLLPFLGTSLGAGCVFFLRRQLRRSVQRVLSGFAAGVMVAALVWSHLLPALEEAEAAGLAVWAVASAAGGFWVGVLFLLLLDHLIPHLHQNASPAASASSRAGISRLHTDAATITPAAKPASTRCTLRRSCRRRKNTHPAPSTVPINGSSSPQTICVVIVKTSLVPLFGPSSPLYSILWAGVPGAAALRPPARGPPPPSAGRERPACRRSGMVPL